jgi:hypothetical protein
MANPEFAPTFLLGVGGGGGRLPLELLGMTRDRSVISSNRILVGLDKLAVSPGVAARRGIPEEGRHANGESIGRL